MATRGRPPGSVKTGGRVKGSLDKAERAIVSSELAHSIMATFEMLGGTAAMVEWAATNQTVFYTQILSRLMPPPQRDDPDTVINVNTGLTEMESARRVAFALAKAVYADPTLTVEHEPQEAYQSPQAAVNEWTPPTDAPGVIPEYEDRPLFRSDPPVTRSLETYAGGAAEQGRTVSRPTAQPKRTAAELCRSLSRRGRDLM
ncbi:hypothetical protein [Pseudomonas fluorescens]|uniref:Uncharacterized protein n=1 Tax=Pseudomonas fluorescens TaxID=294 RepID=A0A5E7U526_PSEFL|nr:hypothetical protein [Pseudomonas fluorescens]VVQ05058.1 hypothetical protein PS928_02962 [Pseudomonas fluorescens]